jgi:hypothetical protein
MVKFSSFLVLYSYVTSCLGEKKKYHCGGHSWRGGLFTKQLKEMSESRIIVRFLRMYFPRNWEFGSALSKLTTFGGGGVEPPNPPRYATVFLFSTKGPFQGHTLPLQGNIVYLVYFLHILLILDVLSFSLPFLHLL